MDSASHPYNMNIFNPILFDAIFCMTFSLLKYQHPALLKLGTVHVMVGPPLTPTLTPSAGPIDPPNTWPVIGSKVTLP